MSLQQSTSSEDYRAVLDVVQSEGDAHEPFSRYLMLADLALLKAARAEQRRIKERIRPSVENYKKLTGRSR